MSKQYLIATQSKFLVKSFNQKINTFSSLGNLESTLHKQKGHICAGGWPGHGHLHGCLDRGCKNHVSTLASSRQSLSTRRNTLPRGNRLLGQLWLSSSSCGSPLSPALLRDLGPSFSSWGLGSCSPHRRLCGWVTYPKRPLQPPCQRDLHMSPALRGPAPQPRRVPCWLWMPSSPPLNIRIPEIVGSTVSP